MTLCSVSAASPLGPWNVRFTARVDGVVFGSNLRTTGVTCESMSTVDCANAVEVMQARASAAQAQRAIRRMPRTYTPPAPIALKITRKSDRRLLRAAAPLTRVDRAATRERLGADADLRVRIAHARPARKAAVVHDDQALAARRRAPALNASVGVVRHATVVDSTRL